MFTGKQHSREDLKNFFRKGGIPTETHFANLIDSMLNKQDDGFAKDDEHGLILSALSNSDRFITLYKATDDLDPFFHIEKDDKAQSEALRFHPPGGPAKAGDEGFFFHVNGNLGIGGRADERHKLQVEGYAGMDGRIGTFRAGEVAADGQWHSIVKDLDNCNAFELMARTGKRGFGKFALLHAYALSTYGRSSSRIKKVSAHYGSFWNRIGARWKSKGTHSYDLQIRTGRNYGKGVMIHYRVTKLWDDEQFLPEEYYYPKPKADAAT